MNIGLHQIAQRRVDAAMARQQRLTGKRRRDDAHAEMPAAVARAGMANVQMTLVLDRQFARRQRSGQASAHALYTPANCGPADCRLAHGNTLWNGRTLTSRYTLAAT